MRPITTVLLAGGEGRRIGGDKALQALHGRPLIEWVLDAIRSGSDEVLISANDNLDAYTAYGYQLVRDEAAGYAGPLAGLQAGLRRARNAWVACVPCDTPFLPPNLLSRLVQESDGAECTVAVAADRRQPTIALYSKDVLAKLDNYLASGGRKVRDWQGSLRVREVVFNDIASFANINTRSELDALAGQMEKECPRSLRTGGKCLN